MLLLIHILRALLHFLVPHRCRRCGASLQVEVPGPSPRVLCATCMNAQCASAQEPQWRVEGLPGRSLLWYEDEGAALIRLVKEGGHNALLRFLASQWPQPPLPVEADFLLVPVPAHALRKRQRGGDHVEELCRWWARQWQLDTCFPLERGKGRSQRGLGAGDRRHNLAEQYRLKAKGPQLMGRFVVLVDDVVTTGATLQLCREHLEGAGARVVGALCLACAPNPRLRLHRMSEAAEGA